jgi:hypothetical protein
MHAGHAVLALDAVLARLARRADMTSRAWLPVCARLAIRTRRPGSACRDSQRAEQSVAHEA